MATFAIIYTTFMLLSGVYISIFIALPEIDESEGVDILPSNI